MLTHLSGHRTRAGLLSLTLLLIVAALALLLFVQRVPAADAQGSISVQFARADYNVLEGSNLSPTLTFDSATTAPATFSIATSAGTATPGTDFTAGPISVTVPAQSTSHTFDIAIPHDDAIEDYETFTITIDAPPSGFTLGANSAATVQIVNVSFVPHNWSLKPSGLNAGDRFRLLFKTVNERNGSSHDISDYDDFVRTRTTAHPWHADIQAYANTFRAVGSTPTVGAAWHTATGINESGTYSHTPFSHAIYWLSGPRIADDYNDFWDGNWDHNSDADMRHADGLAATNKRGPNTGTSSGTTHATAGVKKDGKALGTGNLNTRWGGVNAQNPIDQGDIPKGDNNVYIGLSGVFEVEALPTIGFDQVSYDVREGETLTVTLNVSAAPTTNVTVTVNPMASTATADDWSGGPWSVTLSSSQTTASVDIPIADDCNNEDTEKFTLSLAAENFDPDPTKGSATVRILKADTTPNVVPGDWPLKPEGLTTGDEFRLLFATSSTRDASATSIGAYHAFVRDAAKSGHAGIRQYADTFNVFGSTSECDAREVTGLHDGSGYTDDSTSNSSAGIPIYWLNGDRIANNYHFFLDAVDVTNNLWSAGNFTTEHGGQEGDSRHVLTGSEADGTKDTGGITLGSDDPSHRYVIRGFILEDNNRPISHGSMDRTDQGRLYGMSALFRVGISAGAIITETGNPANTSVAEAGGADTYNVVLESEPTHDVTVTVASGDTTAALVSAAGGTAGPTATLAFTPQNWNTPQTVTVTGVDDNVDNPGDSRATSITHTAQSPDSNYQAIAIDSVPVTVTDDDAAPTAITLSVTSGSVSEGDGPQTITVTATVDGATRFGAEQTVAVTVAGSGGTNVVDFTATPPSFNITIPAGAATGTGTFSLGPTDDNTQEADETVTVSGSASPGGATVNPATITITDDDGPATLPVVNFRNPTSSIAEGSGTVNIALELNPAPTGNITLNYTLSGTATLGTDYTIGGVTSNSGTVSVTSGSTTANIPVAIADDSTQENAETIIVTLNQGADYTLGTTNPAHTRTINDNDTPKATASFAVATSTVGEASGTTNPVVNFDPMPANAITLRYDLLPGGTATLGSDYTIGGSGTGTSRTMSVSPGTSTVSIPITIIDDSTGESPETVVVLINNTGGEFRRNEPFVHTLTITDDDGGGITPEVSITAGSAVTEGGNASFTVSANPAPSSALSVSVTITQSGDYGVATGSQTVSIPTSGSATLTISTSDDSTDESDGSVTVTLNSDQGYTVSTTAGSATVTVRDDDLTPPPSPTPTPAPAGGSTGSVTQQKPVITISAGTSSITEGETAVFTINANPAPASPVIVHLRVSQSGSFVETAKNWR